MKYKRNGRVVILEKVFLCLLLTLLFCGFCACDYDNLNLTEITYQIPQLKSDYEQYEGQVGKYDSPYTVCYKNNDGKYTMYIFSSPIQYKSTEGYQLIDNTLISSEETGFVYENRYNEIKVYLPESIKSFIRIATKTATLEIRLKETGISFENAQRVNFENMYGDEVDAVRYGSDKVDLYLYAIASGLKLEIHSVEGSYVPDLVFVVRSSDTLKQYNRGNYIEFLDSKDAKTISSLIRKPLAMFENDGVVDMSTQTQMKIEQAGDEYELRYDLHKAAAESSDVKLDASFEMYLSSMADCSVYSKYKINNYLDNYSVVGNHPQLGLGWHYARFNLSDFMALNPDFIQSATYCVRELYGHGDMDAYKPCSTWSSLALVWDSRVLAEEKVGSFSSNNNLRVLDITDFLKKCFADRSADMENRGIVLKNNGEEWYSVLSSSDNSMYPPYIKLVLTDLPGYFEPVSDIG